ncbi:MAG: hypothetical protein SPK43_01470 [Candidatus Onthovivens sp.]|nr:hypothetical protein [Candidatus Onthovivens sp.]
MTILAYFIAGYAAINLIDSLISLLCTALEVPKAKLSLKITEYNSKISKIAEEEIPINTNAIGFQAPVSENEEDIDE